MDDDDRDRSGPRGLNRRDVRVLRVLLVLLAVLLVVYLIDSIRQDRRDIDAYVDCITAGGTAQLCDRP